jgi:glycosyltransferase involved in cell wall biosynthesis
MDLRPPRRPTDARPHVLYVAWGFPPMAGGGTFRTLATANTLAKAGFDVTVLTTERRAFVGFTGVDESLEREIDPRIDVRRLRFEDAANEHDVRRWPKKRARAPKAWLKQHTAEGPEFPEKRFGAWRDTLLAAAEEVYRERGVDLVIGSANPHVVLTVGDHLHQRHGVPYVIDHRDAWRLNCYLGTEVGVGAPEIAELETRFMQNAHEVWFVNEAILEWHRALYPQAADKMRVVENGFDRAWAPTPQLTEPDPERPLTFSYVGSVSSQVPVAEFVEGWVRARRISPDLANARARIYGPMAGNVRNRAELLHGARRYGIQHLGPVSKDRVAEVYETSDALLLILGGGRFVTSGKLYEYVASGLPIVSVHQPESGAAEVLRDYPLWFPAADLTVDGVAAALVAAAEGARRASRVDRERAVSFAASKERYAQLQPPIERLHSWVSSRLEQQEATR